MAQVIKDNLHIIENPVTSDGGKINSISANVSGLTASRAVVTDADKNLASSDTTATEIGHVKGVTSSIQTQLNGKQATITGAATTIVADNLTANRVAISNGAGKMAASDITTTELGYLNDVSSNIQTQLNGKQATITGTDNYVARFNGEHDLQNGSIYNDDDGKVGIGTTTPSSRLHVEDSSVIPPTVTSRSAQIVAEGANQQIQIGVPGTDNTRYAWILANRTGAGGGDYYCTLHLQPTIDGTILDYEGVAIGFAPTLKLNSTVGLAVNGNVGIGTETPANKLHIVNGSSGATAISNIGLTVENNTTAAINILSPDANSGVIYFGSPSNNSNATIQANYNSGSPYLALRTNGNNERMRIDSDGKVGIGTASPLTDVEIRPATDETVKLTITGDKSISTVGDEYCSVDFRSGGDSSPLSDNDIVGRIVSVAEYSNGAIAGMAFYTADNSSSPYIKERVRIDHNGYVGIGTDDPAEELHVNGTIRSDDLTASRVVVTDADKNLVSSSITSSSLLGFLSNTLVATQVLNDGSSTDMFEIGILAGMVIGGKFSYTIQATSTGSHAMALTGEVLLTASYDGSIAANIAEIDEIFSGAGGTSMTSAFGIRAGTNKVTISCLCNSSLSSPAILIRYKLEMHIAASITEL